MKQAIFKGSSEEQERWGSYTGNHKKLVVGKEYTIIKEEVHTWHTKVFLEGIEGSFNSACFEPV
jgi:hypothetical protein